MMDEKQHRHFIGSVIGSAQLETKEARFRRRLVELSREKQGLVPTDTPPATLPQEAPVAVGMAMPESVMPSVPTVTADTPPLAQSATLAESPVLPPENLAMMPSDPLAAMIPNTAAETEGVTTPIAEETPAEETLSPADLIQPSGLQPVGGVLVTRASAPLSPAKELADFFAKPEEPEVPEVIETDEISDEITNETELTESTEGDVELAQTDESEVTEAEVEAEVLEEAPVETQAEEADGITEAELSDDELGLSKYAEPVETTSQESASTADDDDILDDPLVGEALTEALYKPKKPAYQTDLQFARELSLAEPKMVAKSIRDWMNPK